MSGADRSSSLNPSVYIGASRGFITAASICYGSMGLALWIANIPCWVATALCLVLALHYWHVNALHGWRSHRYAVQILQQDCAKWQYQLKSGRNYQGSLHQPYSFCSSLVLILYLKHLYGGRYIIIPRDAISAKNYRFLAFKLHC